MGPPWSDCADDFEPSSEVFEWARGSAWNAKKILRISKP